MKKIFALILAIVMTVAISVPVFAEVGTDDETGLSSSTTVKYGVDQTYTVTIPAEVSLTTPEAEGKKSGTTDIVVSEVCIPANRALTLTVTSSKSANGAWQLVDTKGTGASPVNYTISGVQKQSGKDNVTYASIAKGGAVVVVDSAVAFQPATTTLTFLADKTMQVTDYEDTLTFSVSVALKG